MEEKKIIAEPQDRIGEVCIADEVVAVIAVLPPLRWRVWTPWPGTSPTTWWESSE